MDKKELKRIVAHLVVTKTPVIMDGKIIEIIRESFPNNYLISASCSDKNLYGEKRAEFKPPSWYNYLDNHQKAEDLFLIIDLNNSTIEQQRRFISLLQDRSIRTLRLPTNCHVILLSSDYSKVDNELIGLTLRI